MVPRLSAAGLPEVGGGDGQDRNGELPPAPADALIMSWDRSPGTGPRRRFGHSPVVMDLFAHRVPLQLLMELAVLYMVDKYNGPSCARALAHRQAHQGCPEAADP